MTTSTIVLTQHIYNDSPFANAVISLFYQLTFNFQVRFWYEESDFMLKSPVISRPRNPILFAMISLAISFSFFTLMNPKGKVL